MIRTFVELLRHGKCSKAAPNSTTLSCVLDVVCFTLPFMIVAGMRVMVFSVELPRSSRVLEGGYSQCSPGTGASASLATEAFYSRILPPRRTARR
jgi:hypothetical protein